MTCDPLKAGVTLTLQMKHRGPEGTHQLCRVVQLLSSRQTSVQLPSCIRKSARAVRMHGCACSTRRFLLAPDLVGGSSEHASALPQGLSLPSPPSPVYPWDSSQAPRVPVSQPSYGARAQPHPLQALQGQVQPKQLHRPAPQQIPPHCTLCCTHPHTHACAHDKPAHLSNDSAPEATKTSLNLQVGTNRSKSKSLQAPFSGFGETRPERVSLDTGAQFPSLIRKEAIILPPLAGQPQKQDLLFSGADVGWDLHGFCCS